MLALGIVGGGCISHTGTGLRGHGSSPVAYGKRAGLKSHKLDSE